MQAGEAAIPGELILRKVLGAGCRRIVEIMIPRHCVKQLIINRGDHNVVYLTPQDCKLGSNLFPLNIQLEDFGHTVFDGFYADRQCLHERTDML